MGVILVPVDGSDSALRALEYAIKRAKAESGISVHVLTVRPPLRVYGEVAIYVGTKRSQDLADEHDKRLLAVAEKRLSRMRVKYSTEAREGDAATVIARRAKALRCDSIVMGTRGLGRIASLIMGSVAIKVVHLTSLPVTLVK